METFQHNETLCAGRAAHGVHGSIGRPRRSRLATWPFWGTLRHKYAQSPQALRGLDTAGDIGI
jgi:hypothetical protein